MKEGGVACVAVVSVSFKPNGASTKDARGHWAKRSKKFAQCPHASFVLAPLGLKETETTATQVGGGGGGSVTEVQRQGWKSDEKGTGQEKKSRGQHFVRQ